MSRLILASRRRAFTHPSLDPGHIPVIDHAAIGPHPQLAPRPMMIITAGNRQRLPGRGPPSSRSRGHGQGRSGCRGQRLNSALQLEWELPSWTIKSDASPNKREARCARSSGKAVITLHRYSSAAAENFGNLCPSFTGRWGCHGAADRFDCDRIQHRRPQTHRGEAVRDRVDRNSKILI
jgi:hypothetical protein